MLYLKKINAHSLTASLLKKPLSYTLLALLFLCTSCSTADNERRVFPTTVSPIFLFDSSSTDAYPPIVDNQATDETNTPTYTTVRQTGYIDLVSNLEADSDHLGISSNDRTANNTVSSAQSIDISTLPIMISGHTASTSDPIDYFEITVDDTPITIVLDNTQLSQGMALTLYDHEGNTVRKLYNNPSVIHLSESGTYFLSVSSTPSALFDDSASNYKHYSTKTDAIYRLRILKTESSESAQSYPITHFSVIGATPSSEQIHIIQSDAHRNVCAQSLDIYTVDPESTTAIVQPFGETCNLSKTVNQWYVREDNSIYNIYHRRCLGLTSDNILRLHPCDSSATDQLSFGINPKTQKINIGYGSGNACISMISGFELTPLRSCYTANSNNQAFLPYANLNLVPAVSTTGIIQSFGADQTTKQLTVIPLPAVSSDELANISIAYENTSDNYPIWQWATATLTEANEGNQLTLSITLDKADLPLGSFSGRILLQLRNAETSDIEQTFPIEVQTQVQAQTTSSIGPLVVTFDEASGNFDGSIIYAYPYTGLYTFSTSLIQNLQYNTTVSSDFNGNGVLCEIGEICSQQAIYPSANGLLILTPSIR